VVAPTPTGQVEINIPAGSSAKPRERPAFKQSSIKSKIAAGVATPAKIGSRGKASATSKGETSPEPSTDLNLSTALEQGFKLQIVGSTLHGNQHPKAALLEIGLPDTGQSPTSAIGPKRRFENWSFRRPSGIPVR